MEGHYLAFTLGEPASGSAAHLLSIVAATIRCGDCLLAKATFVVGAAAEVTATHNHTSAAGAFTHSRKDGT